MSMTLPPDLEEFVERQLAEGKYQSADEVVREGLRLLQTREKLEKLRTDIDEGLRQRDAGEVVEIPDAESHRAFFERIKQRGIERLRKGDA